MFFNKKFLTILVIGMLLVIPFAGFAQGGPWSVKVGLLGPFNGNIALEGEKSFSQKFSVSLRAGLSSPSFKEGEKLADGFFFKLGPKFYLLGNDLPQTGLSVKPVFIYSKWRNWELERVGRSFEIYETSIGGMIEVGYGIPILGKLRLEPHFGFGVVPTWESRKSVEDHSPFTVLEVKWSLSYYDETDKPPHSHLQLKSLYHLAISGGLNLGIVF